MEFTSENVPLVSHGVIVEFEEENDALAFMHHLAERTHTHVDIWFDNKKGNWCVTQFVRLLPQIVVKPQGEEMLRRRIEDILV